MAISRLFEVKGDSVRTVCRFKRARIRSSIRREDGHRQEKAANGTSVLTLSLRQGGWFNEVGSRFLAAAVQGGPESNFLRSLSGGCCILLRKEVI